MTEPIEHIENAVDELEEAHDKLAGELGTRLMVQRVAEDAQEIAERYHRINDE